MAHTYFIRRLDSIAVRLESILHETIQTFFAHFEVQRSSNRERH
jgi:biopolymer transport protein ExbB